MVVHDRYQNYGKFAGVTQQLCAAHLLRDIEDAAQSQRAAIWPGQIAGALRALIHAANLARQQDLAAVPATTWRRTCGCSGTISGSDCPRSPASRR